jgi:Raf kinase inhibitor-like YbhB/YbcL family protein
MKNSAHDPGRVTLKVSSTAFEDMRSIPEKYGRDGMNINPPLQVEGIPAEAKTLVLIVDDPDVPSKTFVHWLVWNMEPVNFIGENSAPGAEGKNDFGTIRYEGPHPPSGTHRYFFRVYALDGALALDAGATRPQLEKAMEARVIAYGELVGLFHSHAGQEKRKYTSVRSEEEEETPEQLPTPPEIPGIPPEMPPLPGSPETGPLF